MKIVIECKDCKYKKGNCGHHFILDGVMDYDIPSLTACDKYGNCMFFERDEEDESKGDLISREALKKALEKSTVTIIGYGKAVFLDKAYELIDNALTVERPTGEWIPVSEKLPDVGQVVIVTDDRGKVYEYELNPLGVDKYTTGKWRFLEHEIIAWMPLPEPYKKGGAE